MTLEVGLWRAEGTSLTRLSPSGIALERQLEDYIEADPMLLGEQLLIVGRQVPTVHGGFIDLLAIDADGVIHVLELKRDKTPRDVVGLRLLTTDRGLPNSDGRTSLTSTSDNAATSRSTKPSQHSSAWTPHLMRSMRARFSRSWQPRSTLRPSESFDF